MKQPRKVITKGTADSRSPSKFYHGIGVGHGDTKVFWDKEDYLQAIAKEKEKPQKFRTSVVYRDPQLIEIDKQEHQKFYKEYRQRPEVKEHTRARWKLWSQRPEVKVIRNKQKRAKYKILNTKRNKSFPTSIKIK